MRTTSKTILLLGVILLACNGLWGCGGGGGGELKVGDIQCPDSMDEYSFADFSLAIEGGSGVTCQWTVNPTIYGLFINPSMPATAFRTSGVSSDAEFEIRAIVSSKNNAPIVVSKKVNVKDKTLTIPNLKEVDFMPITFISENDGRYTFSYSGQAPIFEKGDVILSYYQGGYLRTVDDMVYTESTVVLETTQALMVDAIKESHFETTMHFGGHSGSIVTPLNNFRSAAYDTIEFDLIQEHPDWAVLYDADGIMIELTQCKASFSPDLTISADITDEGLVNFESILEGDFNATVDVVGNVNKVFNETWEKNVYSKSEWFFVEGAPIFGLVTFDFIAGVSLDAGMSIENVTVGGSVDDTIKIGATYDKDEDPQWTAVWDETPPQFTYRDVTIEAVTGDVAIRPYIHPEVTIKFYAVAGPGLNIEPYLKLGAVVDALEQCAIWDLSGGVGAGIFMELGIIDLEMGRWEHEILSEEVTFAEGDYPEGCSGDGSPYWIDEDKVGILSAVPGDQSVEVTFGTAVDPEGGDVTYTLFYIDEDDIADIDPVAWILNILSNPITGLIDLLETFSWVEDITNPYLLTGLENGHTYWLCVKAVDQDQNMDLNDKILSATPEDGGPLYPAIVGLYSTNPCHDINVTGDIAYLASGPLVILDVSDLTSPILLGKSENYGYSRISVDNNRAYMLVRGLGPYFDIFDVTNPANIYTLGQSSIFFYFEDIWGDGDSCYLALTELWTGGVLDFDVSNPGALSYVSVWGDWDVSVTSLLFEDNLGYLACGDGLKIIDVGLPPDNALLGEFETFGVHGIAKQDNFVYIAVGSEGVRVIDVSNMNSPSLATGFDTYDALDVGVSGELVVVADGDRGIKVFNLINLTEPSLAWKHNTDGNSERVEISGNFAFIADSDKGMKIVQLR